MRALLIGMTMSVMLAPSVLYSQITFENSYALVIGVENYDGTNYPSLSTPSKDAQVLASELERQGYDVTVLTDSSSKPATRSRIVDELERLAAVMGPSDRFLFYFGGHGYTQTIAGVDVGYVVPAQAGLDRSTHLSFEEIRFFANTIRARHQLYLFNSCFGAHFVKLRSAVQPPFTDPVFYLNEITRKKAVQFASAGGKNEKVVDNGPNGHSPFAYYLIDALTKGWVDRRPSDGVITFQELSVIKEHATTPFSTPVFTDLGAYGGEYVFLSPQGIPATKPPSAVADISEITTRSSLSDEQLARQAFRERYLEYAPGQDTNWYYTFVGSHSTEEAAWQQVADIKERFPNMDADVYPPFRDSGYFGVAMAASTTLDRAIEIREFAKLNINPTSFVWEPPSDIRSEILGGDGN